MRLLGRARKGDEAGFGLLDPVAVSIDRAKTCCVCPSPNTMAAAQACVILADDLGRPVIVETVQAPDHRRTPVHAARLHALSLVHVGEQSWAIPPSANGRPVAARPGVPLRSDASRATERISSDRPGTFLPSDGSIELGPTT